MERIRAEQNLQVHNPEVCENYTDDLDPTRSALQTKKVKGKVTELTLFSGPCIT